MGMKSCLHSVDEKMGQVGEGLSHVLKSQSWHQSEFPRLQARNQLSPDPGLSPNHAGEGSRWETV